MAKRTLKTGKSSPRTAQKKPVKKAKAAMAPRKKARKAAKGAKDPLPTPPGGDPFEL